MINMQDKSMIFTLNGEILITTKGSELCFTDFDAEDGEEAPSRPFEAEVIVERLFQAIFFLNTAFTRSEKKA